VTDYREVIKFMSPDYVAATPAGTVFTEGYHFIKTGATDGFSGQVGGQPIYNKYYKMGQIYKGAGSPFTINGQFFRFEDAKIFKGVRTTWNSKTAKFTQIQRLVFTSYSPAKTGTISAAPSDTKTFTLGSAQTWAANDVLFVKSGAYENWCAVAVALGSSSTSFVVSEKVGNLAGFVGATYEIYNGNASFTWTDGTSGNFKAETYKGMITAWQLADLTTVGTSPGQRKNFTVSIDMGAAITTLT